MYATALANEAEHSVHNVSSSFNLIGDLFKELAEGSTGVFRTTGGTASRNEKTEPNRSRG